MKINPFEMIRNELWRRGDLSWKLDPHQKQVSDLLAENKSDEVLFLCSRQFGKSYLNLIYALEFAIKNPRAIVRIAAPTLKQCASIVDDNLNHIIRDAPAGLIKRHKSDYRYNLSNGSSLRLGALERAHVDSLRGGNAKLVIAEEGGFVSNDDYAYAVTSVIAPQLLRSSGRLIHVTTPSDEPEHYIHTETLPKCEINGSLFRRTIYDNSALSEEQIDRAAKLCGGVESEAFKREYLVQIIRSLDMTVIPEWADAYVEAFEYPQYATTITSMDTGGVQDKTVALVCFYNFQTGETCFVDERVFDSNTASSDYMLELQHMESLYPNISDRYADAPGQLLIDLRFNHNYFARLPLKDDWQASLNDFRIRVGSGKVKVHPRCSFLIATLKGATFNKQRTDFARTKALGHMDAIAAALYANRMLDRNKNPYPVQILNPETHWIRPNNAHRSNLESAASAINPYAKRRR